MNVYVAAPYAQASFVRVIHEHLESVGVRPTATWPLHARGPEDFTQYSPDTLREALARNERDIRGSDVVLVYDPAGEGRETYAEAARALVWGRAVVWCSRRGLSQYARGVVRAEDLDDAIAILVAMRARHAEGIRGELLAHLARGAA